jgi:hypothetical protein
MADSRPFNYVYYAFYLWFSFAGAPKIADGRDLIELAETHKPRRRQWA